ncbi:hypothetical protein ACVW19_004327 [Streptomyces sp. TE5632]
MRQKGRGEPRAQPAAKAAPFDETHGAGRSTDRTPVGPRHNPRRTLRSYLARSKSTAL